MVAVNREQFRVQATPSLIKHLWLRLLNLSNQEALLTLTWRLVEGRMFLVLVFNPNLAQKMAYMLVDDPRVLVEHFNTA